jgi:hypothetical protein
MSFESTVVVIFAHLCQRSSLASSQHKLDDVLKEYYRRKFYFAVMTSLRRYPFCAIDSADIYTASHAKSSLQVCQLPKDADRVRMA